MELYRRHISGQWTGHYISGMIRITIRIQYSGYYPDRSARVCIIDQFCKIYNNCISKYIGAYPFSVVIIDLEKEK